MTDIEKIELELKNKKYNKTLFATIKDTMWVWLQELSEKVWNLFSHSNNAENQISKELENYEKKVITLKPKVN